MRTFLFSRTGKALIVIAGLVVLYALVGFFVLPPVIKSQITSQIQEKLGRQATVREVSVNPFQLSLTINGFDIPDRDQQTPMVGFEEFHVNFQLSSLLNRAYTFHEIRLILPYARPEVLKDGHLNLLDLVPPPSDPALASPEAAPDPGERTLPPVIIGLLHVDRGVVEFHDLTKKPPFEANIVPIGFTLQNFRTVQGSENPHKFTAEFGKDEVLNWEGTLSFKPIQSTGTVSLTNLHTRTLWDYVQEPLRFEITDGVLDLHAKYNVDFGGKAIRAVVSDGEFSMKNLKLGEKGGTQPLISVPAFTISGIDVDMTRRDVTIASITSKDARVAGWMNKDGVVNFQQLFGSKPTAEEPAKDDNKVETQTAAVGQPQSEWRAQVKEISLEKYGLTFEDRQPATPMRITIEPLTLNLKHVTWPPKKPIDVNVSLKLNETGSITANGIVSIEPLSVDMVLDLSQIAFKPFQPYVDQVARVALLDGAAHLEGHLRYAKQHENGPQIRFDGTAGITRFKTKDRSLNQDLVKWDALTVKGLALDVEPTKVKIGEVTLQKPLVRAVVGPDGAMNLAKLMVAPSGQGPVQATASQTTKKEAKRSKKPSTERSTPITIDTVRITDGAVQFADLAISPPVNIGLQSLTGTIKALSSTNLTKADVAIEAKVGSSAPLKISGKINPLSDDAYTDLVVLVKSMELMAVSPYSGKYAGHPITKGQLSLDLQYKLSKKHLEAENKVLVDQLSMGNKTNSPDATSLPVPLVVGLLKDRRGQIDVDLPVRGNLDDPDFKYGRAVLNVLVNLLTKVALSPFSALGKLVPGGSEDELKMVNFAPGSATLSREEEKKLTALGKALEERPGLRLEVTGAIDPRADRVAMAEARVRRDMQAMKVAELKADGKQVPADAEAVELSEADYTRLMRQAYVKTYGQEPAVGGIEKGPADPAAVMIMMKETLRAAITIEDADLQVLAQERADRIKDFLLKQGALPAERVFLTDAKMDGSAEKDVIASPMTLSAG
ncbi:MAG: DUF748 domain-containing protein [Nitrospiraceae bacterium]